MADKWQQGAVKREGRVRMALGLKEGQPVTNAALDGFVARKKKAGTWNKSWAGAVGLARRYIPGGDLYHG